MCMCVYTVYVCVCVCVCVCVSQQISLSPSLPPVSMNVGFYLCGAVFVCVSCATSVKDAVSPHLTPTFHLAPCLVILVTLKTQKGTSHAEINTLVASSLFKCAP